MALDYRPHPRAPVIFEWCSKCKIYLSHDHGFMFITRASFMRCQQCGLESVTR